MGWMSACLGGTNEMRTILKDTSATILDYLDINTDSSILPHTHPTSNPYKVADIHGQLYTDLSWVQVFLPSGLITYVLQNLWYGAALWRLREGFTFKGRPQI